MESAAGAAGLIKVLLQLKHNTLVPSLYATPPNPHLHIEDTPFFLIQDPQTWKKNSGAPRRALVNSFGAGGANASVIIEEHHCKDKAIDNGYHYLLPYYIIPISAKSISALQAQLDVLRVWIQQHRSTDLYPIAYTLSCAREQYPHRICFVVRNVGALLEKLMQPLFVLRSANKMDSIHMHAHNADIDYRYSLLLAMQNEELKKTFDQLSAMYQYGDHHVRWSTIYQARSIINLPTYVFDKHPHWIDAPKYGLTKEKKYIDHHQIEQQSIAPAAFILSKMLAQLGNGMGSLQEVYWLKPITTFDDLNYIVAAQGCSIQDKEGNIYFQGEIGPNPISLQPDILKNIQNQGNTFTMIEHQDIYSHTSSCGYHYGSTYRKLGCVQRFYQAAIGVIYGNADPDLPFNPSIIDAGFQVAMMCAPLPSILREADILLPFYVKTLNIYTDKLDNLAYCYCMLNDVATVQQDISYNIYFVNVDNQILMSFEGMVSKSVNKDFFLQQNLLSANRNPNASLAHTNIKIYTFKK